MIDHAANEWLPQPRKDVRVGIHDTGRGPRASMADQVRYKRPERRMRSIDAEATENSATIAQGLATGRSYMIAAVMTAKNM